MSYFTRSDELPDWATQVPPGWDSCWLKWSVDLSTKRPTEEEKEALPYIANEDIASWTGRLLTEGPKPSEAASRTFQQGDVLFNKLRPYVAKVYHATFDGVSSGELLCLRPSHLVEPRFLFYVLVSKGFIDTVNAETFGAKMPRADWEIVGHQPLPLPAHDTQRRIVCFLDEKTARIDGLIEKKRALLDRLAEKRHALVTLAVTRGLNPAVQMKSSGIDWLGDIPAHWEIRGLTKCTNRVDYRGATPEKSSSGVFLVTAKNIKNGQIDYEASKEYIPEETYEHVMRRGKPKLGEVLFTTEAPLGEIARVEHTDIALAQRIIKFAAALEDLTNDYLAYWMYSSAFRADVASRATGSTALGIKASKIVELRCLLPPKHEQIAISKFLDDDAAARNEAVTGIRTTVQQLAEYRAALIAAAVTGQVAGLR